MGYGTVKMKIGGGSIDEDRRRIEAVLEVVGDGQALAVDANGRYDLKTAIAYAEMLKPYGLRWYEEAGDPLDFALQAEFGRHMKARWRPARTCSRCRTDRRRVVQGSRGSVRVELGGRG